MLKSTKIIAFLCLLALAQLKAESSFSDLVNSGNYQAATARLEIEAVEIFEVIPLWIATGNIQEGMFSWKKATELTPLDLHGQYAGIELLQLNGENPQETINFITKQLDSLPIDYRDPKGLVLRGKIALLNHADASQVMRDYFELALSREPGQLDALMASAELSLSKGDRQNAFETLQEYYEDHKNNPDFLHLGYLIMKEDMPDQAKNILEEALVVNPNHLPSLISKAQTHLIKHDLKRADEVLEHIMSFNENHAQAWALKALMAHIKEHKVVYPQFMELAFTFWKHHPQVYLLMGETYLAMGRLNDALESYRQAVEHHPKHVEALLGYSQCLLQSGFLEEAFDIAEKIYENDAYQKRAFNLLELRDQINDFETLKKGHLSIRMPALDASIYGDRALAFIGTSYERLATKYGLTISDNLYVDFFDRAQDYATRTFGFPQDYGTLGICFGQAITAKTVAAHDKPHHLGKILWHEVAHVVTLKLSDHKIPRWFTEGISVYEENLLFSSNTHGLTPKFKQRIERDGLFKVENFDHAFHYSETIGLAYFLAGWMLEHLIDEHGFEAIKACVHDLKTTTSKESFEKHFGSLEKMDKSFEAFVETRMKAYAPEADFQAVPFGVELNFVEDREPWLKENPNHITALKLEAKYRLNQGEEKKYLEILSKIDKLHPEDLSDENATLFFADYYKKKEQTDKEIEYLEQYRARDFNHIPSRRRLLELYQENKNYKALEKLCHELFYLTPLSAELYETFALIQESQMQQQSANVYYEKCIKLKSKNASKIHTHLAQQYLKNQKQKAMQHVLKAIEISPRNKDALRLYISLKAK